MRHYVIFNKSELGLVDFNQTVESNLSTLRYSRDGELTFVKWEGSEPSFVSTLTTKVGVYNQTEMLDILTGPNWRGDIVTPV
jgi:hypothetical protein